MAPWGDCALASGTEEELLKTRGDQQEVLDFAGAGVRRGSRPQGQAGLLLVAGGISRGGSPVVSCQLDTTDAHPPGWGSQEQ